jgi:hypothetical protein
MQITEVNDGGSAVARKHLEPLANLVFSLVAQHAVCQHKQTNVFTPPELDGKLVSNASQAVDVL